MFDRKYYVICEQNCKFESMTKEQILTAIAQAVETGEIKDVDTGFVQTIKTINGVGLKFFIGTQSEYEALTDAEKQNLFAIITNDTTKESIEAMLAKCESDIATLSDTVCGVLSAGLLKGGTQKDDFEFIENGSWYPDPCGNYYSYSSATIRTMYGSGSENIRGWVLRGFHIVDDNYLQLLFTADKIFARTGSKVNGERRFSTWLQIAGEGTTVLSALSASSASEAVLAENAQLLTSDGWIYFDEWINKGSIYNHQQKLENGGVYLVTWGELQSEELKTGIANLASGYALISDYQLDGTTKKHYTICITPTYALLHTDSEIDYITGLCAKRIM